MARLKGFWPFLGYTVGLFVALRLIHLVVPMLHPELHRGPYRVARIEEAPRHLGFSPLMPYYRPQRLGFRPVEITITQQPAPRVVLAWQGDNFLRLTEQRGTPYPVPAQSRPLDSRPGAHWWRDGETLHAVLEVQGIGITVETDLPERDFQRVVDTLRPFEDLR
jgi:hypothetical protein